MTSARPPLSEQEVRNKVAAALKWSHDSAFAPRRRRNIHTDRDSLVHDALAAVLDTEGGGRWGRWGGWGPPVTNLSVTAFYETPFATQVCFNVSPLLRHIHDTFSTAAERVAKNAGETEDRVDDLIMFVKYTDLFSSMYDGVPQQRRPFVYIEATNEFNYRMINQVLRPFFDDEDAISGMPYLGGGFFQPVVYFPPNLFTANYTIVDAVNAFCKHVIDTFGELTFEKFYRIVREEKLRKYPYQRAEPRMRAENLLELMKLVCMQNKDTLLADVAPADGTLEAYKSPFPTLKWIKGDERRAAEALLWRVSKRTRQEVDRVQRKQRN